MKSELDCQKNLWGCRGIFIHQEHHVASFGGDGTLMSAFMRIVAIMRSSVSIFNWQGVLLNFGYLHLEGLMMSKWEKIREIHANSVKSYHQGLLDGSFSDREQEIIDALKTLHKATDRQIMEYLGYEDMNCIRPRLTELIKEAAIVEEIGSRHDLLTNKKVRLVRIIPFNDNNQMALNI